MSALRVAVVGHTNTGKTSLLRTLTRDVSFGEVSDRPAVTRDVRGAALLADGAPVIELFDTPGMEDSIGLLEHLDGQSSTRRDTGREVIERFLDSEAARGRFAQEAKALRQVLASDIALYVIDARDRVHGKHRDELEILGRTAVPVVPVLNFVAGDEARTDEWREHLARVNMHAVAAFDTMVVDGSGERRLFEKMRTLLHDADASFDALLAARDRERATLVTASARLIADMLVDCAAYVGTVELKPGTDEAGAAAAVEQFRDVLRDREQACLTALLDLHRFRPDDCVFDDLPVVDGAWGLDLFNPDAMKSFGVRATGAATAGALAGLTVDVLAGGASLGLATAAGATLGAILETGRSHGRKIMNRLAGQAQWRVDDGTVRLLAARQIAVVQALLRRGHAGVRPTKVASSSALRRLREARLPRPLRRARSHPAWSRLGPMTDRADDGRADPARQGCADDLAPWVEGRIGAEAEPDGDAKNP